MKKRANEGGAARGRLRRRCRDNSPQLQATDSPLDRRSGLPLSCPGVRPSALTAEQVGDRDCRCRGAPAHISPAAAAPAGTAARCPHARSPSAVALRLPPRRRHRYRSPPCRFLRSPCSLSAARRERSLRPPRAVHCSQPSGGAAPRPSRPPPLDPARSGPAPLLPPGPSGAALAAASSRPGRPAAPAAAPPRLHGRTRPRRSHPAGPRRPPRRTARAASRLGRHGMSRGWRTRGRSASAAGLVRASGTSSQTRAEAPVLLSFCSPTSSHAAASRHRDRLQ